MEPLSPIALFVYNRPEHTEKTVAYLKNNTLAKQSELFVFCDGPKTEKDVQKTVLVRKIIKSLTGFKNITIKEGGRNLGLANSVISGVTEVIENYNKAIVVEDDLITSPNFLNFMNESLEKYASCKNIFSVSGYSYPIRLPADYSLPVYLAYRGSSWGWATWKDRWLSVDWEVSDFIEMEQSVELQKRFNRAGEDLYRMLVKQKSGKIDSWAIRFVYAANKQNSLHLFPVISKVQNIGHDNSGRHSGNTSKYVVPLDSSSDSYQLPEDIAFNSIINKEIYNFHKPGIIKSLKNSALDFLS